jgi:hypothetical protein
MITQTIGNAPRNGRTPKTAATTANAGPNSVTTPAAISVAHLAPATRLLVAILAVCSSLPPALAFAGPAAETPAAENRAAEKRAAETPNAGPPASGPASSPPATVPASISAVPAAGPTTAPVEPILPPASIPPGALVIHLPGIGGYLSIDRSLVVGLKRGGVKANFRIIDWTAGDSGLDALFSRRRNLSQAARVGRLIAERFHADPADPIYVTCHSGGAGVAAWAIERLPPDVSIAGWLMMAPALSPTFDLTPALRHVRGKLDVFISDGDGVLGVGTRMFGTIDGVKTDAAGRVGFAMPPGADPAEYAKIVTHPYDPAWLRFGDTGDHIGAMRWRFAAAILAPILRDQLTGAPREAATRP